MLQELEHRNRLQSRRQTLPPRTSGTLMTTNSRLDHRRGSDMSYFSRETYFNQTSNANFFITTVQDLEGEMKLQFPSLYVMYVCKIFCLPLDYHIFVI